MRTLGATSSRFMLGIQQYFFHVTIINRDGGWNAAPIAIAEVQFYPGALQVLLPALRHGGSAKEPKPNCIGLGGNHREVAGAACAAQFSQELFKYHVRPAVAVARRPSPAAALPASPLAQPAALPGCRPA